MSAVKEWISGHRGLSLVLSATLVLVIGLGALVGQLGSGTTAEQVAAMKKDLNTRIDTAQTALDESYAETLAGLGGVDADRIRRDTAWGTKLTAEIASTSSSTLSLAQLQALLISERPSLEGSTLISQFLPGWISVTTAEGPVLYEIGEINVQVAGIKGLDYDYIAVTRLDPVSLDESAEPSASSEYLLLRWSTDQDGKASKVAASRVSSTSRDALLAAEAEAEESAESTATPTPSATPSPTTTTTDDDDSEGEEK